MVVVVFDIGAEWELQAFSLNGARLALLRMILTLLGGTLSLRVMTRVHAALRFRFRDRIDSCSIVPLAGRMCNLTLLVTFRFRTLTLPCGLVLIFLAKNETLTFTHLLCLCPLVRL